VYGPIAFFDVKGGGTASTVIDRLPVGEAARVADFLATPVAPVAPWSTSTATVTSALRGKLVILRDGQLTDFDPGTRPEPQFYLIYFSAGWCGPCHRFTPALVSAYKTLRETGATDFEVVFVSSDESGSDMIEYMKEMGMPWPALAWKKLGSAEVVTQFAGRGIPCLVVLDRAGHMLFHSYSGEEYLGADTPLDQFRQLRALCAPGNPEMAGIRYRFERNAYLGRNPSSTLPPKPYIFGLNPARFREKGVTHFRMSLSIAADGTVTYANVLDEIPFPLGALAEEQAKRWLFFPGIKNGQFCAEEVILPVNIEPRSETAAAH